MYAFSAEAIGTRAWGKTDAAGNGDK